MTLKPSIAMPVRAAQASEIDALARIWHDGWQDAHARILPVELARYRTLESFMQRLQAALPRVRVMGAAASPVGFCIVHGDELYQLYVSSSGRGMGVGGALLADAESRLSAQGVDTAWLACAIGNERGAMFYQRHGWERTGTIINQLTTPVGLFPLEVWRFSKGLRSARPTAPAKISA